MGGAIVDDLRMNILDAGAMIKVDFASKMGVLSDTGLPVVLIANIFAWSIVLVIRQRVVKDFPSPIPSARIPPQTL